MSVDNQKSSCPISCTLEIWGDKWTLLIIRDLMLFEKRTFSDFLKSKEKIPMDILTSRLQSLEEKGMISKGDHLDSEAKILYGLTRKGIDMLPVIIEIMLWGDKYYNVAAEIKPILEDIIRNRKKFIEDKVKELESAIPSKKQRD